MTAAGGTWVGEVPQTETAGEGHARLSTRLAESAANTYPGRAPAGHGVPVVFVGHARVTDLNEREGGRASRGIVAGGCAVMSSSSLCEHVAGFSRSTSN